MTPSGLVDMRKTKITGPTITGSVKGYPDIKRIMNRPEFTGVSWRDIDFTGSDFGEAMFVGCEISNCIFERANCQNIGFWDVRLAGCNFNHANLRSSVWGALSSEQPRPNVFKECTFDCADLRDTVHFAEQYYSCSFRNSRLRKLQLDGTVFKDCVFEGALDQLMFLKRSSRGPDLPENSMEGCDLSKCTLKFVEFRNMNLTNTRLPLGGVHIFLPRGPEDLLEWSRRLGEDSITLGALGFIKFLAETCGTPSIIAESDITKNFSKEQIDLLRRVASGGAKP